MTVTAVLWKYKSRKDGSCNIKFYVHSDEGKKYIATKLYAQPRDWDERSGRLKQTAPNWKVINSILEREQNKLIGQLLGADDSLIDLIESYIEECKNGVHSLTFNTWRQYVTHLGKLKAYCISKGKGDLFFSEIDLEFRTEFLKFLNSQGLGTPGQGKQIKHLRKFLRVGFDRGLHENRIFENARFAPTRYKAPPKIYLNDDEIETIKQLDFTDSNSLQKEQDRFIVSYYFLLRYGDSRRISKENFFTQRGQLYFKNQAEKTGAVSIVPVSPTALDILRRRDYDFSGGANQDSNRKLKVIAARANINTTFQGQPKWSYVTTHTARRSSATNLHLRGVPLREIMQLGGWSSEKILRKYLLAGGIELAAVSASRDFFQ